MRDWKTKIAITIVILALLPLTAKAVQKVRGTLWVSGPLHMLNQQELRLNETGTNGSNYVFMKAPSSLAGNIGFVMPSAGCDGAITASNSSGTMTLTCSAVADLTSGTFSGTLTGSDGSVSA